VSVLQATLSLYAHVLARAGGAAVRNWRLALVTPVYLLIMNLVAQVAAPLGSQLGGLVLGLVQAACFSLWLHLLDEAVRDGGRVLWRDFRTGFGAYFWQVIRVLFVFWIANMVIRPMISSGNGAVLFFVLKLAVAVALNAVPELLYVDREDGFSALGGSVRFIQQNWIEWLVPVVAGGWVLVILDPWFWIGAISPSDLGSWATVLNPLNQVQIVAMRLSAVQTGMPKLVAAGLLSVLVFYYLMLVRGFLYRALSSHSQRTRLYRHRMGLD